MDRRLNLIKIPNPFNRIDREVSTVPFNGESLAEVRAKFAPKDVDFVVSLNGKVIPVHDQAHVALRDGDYITLVPRVAGDNPLQAIAMIAIIVIAAIAQQYWVGPAVMAGTMSYGVGTGIIAGIMVVGGLVVNALLPPPGPQTPGSGDTSQSYAWSPKTTQKQGGAIPRVYGLNRAYGNVISAYLENINDQQYVNCLLDLGMGPASRLYDFKINDQPIGNLRGVEIRTLLGNLDQDAILNFNDTKVEYLFSSKVSYGTPVTVSSQRNDFDGLEVDIVFPQGLWQTNDQGNFITYEVTLRVMAKLQGTSSWIVLTQSGTDLVEYVYDGKWSAGCWTWNSDGSEGGGGTTTVWTEIATGGTNPYSYYDGQAYGDGNFYWRWIQTGTEVVATRIIDTVTIKASSVHSIRNTFRKMGLAHGVYDIQIEKLTGDRNSTRFGDEVYLTSVREVFNDDFEYPRRVLVGIRALASEQLSGSLRFSCMLEGALINTYSGSVWTLQYSNNPAWICWDILTQPVLNNNLTVSRYDGIDPSRLDIIKFLEWAQFCDELVPDGNGGLEKRITFNGSFDTEGTLWDAVLRVCQVGRATPVWTGKNLTVAIDKASSPVALFTVGNIGIDSFRAPFVPLSNRAAEIEIDFLNSDKDYERDSFSVFDPNISGSEKVTLSLYGITKPSEAWRAAKYRLNCNRYLKRSAEIQIDADALACTIGDVVNVAHDVPQWGYSGRIVSATTDAGNVKITLDRSVTIAADKTYEIQYRLNDDTLVTKTVLDGPGTYTEITVAGDEIVLNGGFEIPSSGGGELTTDAGVPLDTDTGIGLMTDGGTPGGNTFAGWTENLSGTTTISLDLSEKEEGLSSARFDVDGSGSQGYLSQTYTLVPGRSYCFSYRQKTSSGNALNRRIHMMGAGTGLPNIFLKDDGTWQETTAYYMQVLQGNGVWTFHPFLFTVPAGYTTFTVYPVARDNDAGKSVWFDAVSVMRIPEQYCPFSFGASNLSVKPFRVVNMERSADLRFLLSLVEYNTSIYGSDLEEPVLPTPNYSAMEDIASVIALSAEEKLIAGDGGINTVIDVSFHKPTTFVFMYAEIWYSKDGGTFAYAGRSVDGSFRISSVEDLATYRIKAISVNNLGVRQSFTDAAEVSLYVFGKTSAPQDVSEFWFEPSQGGIRLSWTPVTDVDLDYYLIKWHPDSGIGTWGTALEVTKIYSTSLSMPAARDGIYFIKAVDLSGNESVTAKTVVTTIPSILRWDEQSHLIQETSWSGTKTGMTVNGGDLYLDSGGNFDDISDLDALENWDYAVPTIPAEGTYEIAATDLESVQNCRCYGELIYYPVDREVSFNDIQDLDALDNFNGAEILGVGMQMQIALSQNGSSWGDWQNFLIGDYRAQAFKFRLRAWSNYATRYCYADSLHIGIDMPERVEHAEGVSIAAGGTSITYATPFISRPQVGIAVESGSSGDTIILSSQSINGFTVQILNAGSGVARTVDWRAVGF